jgi:hypothetical protein
LILKIMKIHNNNILIMVFYFSKYMYRNSYHDDKND